MIDEGFINAIYFKCFNKYDTSMKNKKSYLEIKQTLDKWKKNNKDQFPVDLATKTSLLQDMLKYVIEGVPVNDVLKRIVWSGSYKQLHDSGFVEAKINEKVNEQELTIINDRIKITRMDMLLDTTVNNLETFIAKYRNGEFNTKDIQMDKFLEIQGNVQMDIKKEQRIVLNNQSGGFNTSMNDETNLDNTFDKFKDRCDYTNKIPTKFDLIDTRVLRGGFEKTRLYCVGGQAKSGKSTFLSNIFINAAKEDYRDRVGSDKKPKIFVFITLENSEDELFSRCYSNMFKINEEQILKDMETNDSQMKQNFCDAFNPVNNICDFKYYPSNSFHVDDLTVYLEDCVDKYSESWETECVIGAVYVDYLNLMGGGSQDDWKGLGNIAKSFKILAEEGIRSPTNVRHTFPIITASQLKRPERKITHPSQLDPSQIGESYRIVQIVDGLLLMAPSDKNKNEVYFNSGAQRNGEGNIPIFFKVDFKTYSFVSCKESNNEDVVIETGDMNIPNDCVIPTTESLSKDNRVIDSFNKYASDDNCI